MHLESFRSSYFTRNRDELATSRIVGTTKGQIYKNSATLQDSLEHRLKREFTCKRDSFIPVQIMISDILI